MDQGHSSTVTAPPGAAWPPDDTEESVLGSGLHQGTITDLRLGLNELAASLAQPGGEPPWHAEGQTMITGWRRRDGSRYTTLPDIFVYHQPMDPRRPSFSLERDGPPLLIIEVLSPATHRADLDERVGKPDAYRRGGVREYLALDPLGEFVDSPERGRGWRLEGDVYRPWRPDAAGRWHSEQLGALIGLQGLQVAVADPAGRRQLRVGEVNREIARRDAELASRDSEIARRDAEIAELRRQLERGGG